jgi:hypothetical protein
MKIAKRVNFVNFARPSRPSAGPVATVNLVNFTLPDGRFGAHPWNETMK